MINDGQPEFSPITAVIKARRDKGSKISVVEMKCYQCNEHNYLARNCLVRRNQQREQDSRLQKRDMHCFRSNKLGHVTRTCSGKRIRERGTIAIFAPFQSGNAAFLVINMQMDGVQYSALVDTGCFHSIVTANSAWRWRHLEIRTNDGMSQACCGVGVVSAQREVIVLRLTYWCCMKILLGMTCWSGLMLYVGGIEITPTGEVEVGRKRETCAAIIIEEPDFCATFDHKEKA